MKMETKDEIKEGHEEIPLETLKSSNYKSIDSDIKSETTPEDNSDAQKVKITRTACACAAYFCVSLNLGLVGPSLLYFENQTGCKTSKLSIVFTCRGILATLASLFLGPVFDKLNHYFLVSISVFFLGVFTIVSPYSFNLSLFLVLNSPAEFFGCLIGIGSHLICVGLWKTSSDPALQALNLVSVIGYTVAPLLINIFTYNALELSEKTNKTTGIISKHNVLSENFSFDNINRSLINDTNFEKSTQELIFQNVIETNTSETDFHFAYIVVGVLSIVISFWMSCYVLQDGYVVNKSSDEIENEDKVENDSGRLFALKISVLYFIFNIFYGGLEIGYSGLITTFAVKYLKWTSTNGTNLVALLQFSNALITALAIIFSKFIRPNIIISADLIVVTLSFVTLLIGVHYGSWCLWLFTSFIGAGYATIMPSSYAYANSVISVDGKFSSFYWCGFFTGFLTIPSLTGWLFEAINEMWLLYSMLICCLSMTVVFTVIYWVINNHSIT